MIILTRQGVVAPFSRRFRSYLHSIDHFPVPVPVKSLLLAQGLTFDKPESERETTNWALEKSSAKVRFLYMS